MNVKKYTITPCKIKNLFQVNKYNENGVLVESFKENYGGLYSLRKTLEIEGYILIKGV